VERSNLGLTTSTKMTNEPSKTEHETFPIRRGKGKDKAIPLQAWTGLEDSRRTRLPDFKTIDTWS